MSDCQNDKMLILMFHVPLFRMKRGCDADKRKDSLLGKCDVMRKKDKWRNLWGELVYIWLFLKYY